MSRKFMMKSHESGSAAQLKGRRRGFTAIATVGMAASLVLAGCSSGSDDASSGGDNPLSGSTATNMQGKSLTLGYSRIGGWPPSAAPEAMFPAFQAYAKENYGYDVDLTFAEAPFGELFQKIAPTLAAGSQEFNIMIVDSQWLGALAEPGWIVPADKIYDLNPELDIEPFSSLVTSTYQVYPDGSGQRWGFPQMPDTQGVFLRLDMLEDPANQAAFEAEYGKPLPTTYEEYEEIMMDDFVEIVAFFNDQDNGMYGTALQYSKDYDFFSCAYYPFAYSRGGEIWNPDTNQIYGVLNSDVNAAAMEEFVGLKKYQPASFATQGIGEVVDLFTTSQAFSAFQWLAIGKFMIAPELEGKVLAIPLPKFEGPDGKPKIVGAMGGQPWVVNSFNDDDHMRVSVDFLKWWYLPETQDSFILENGGLPWSKEGLNNETYLNSAPYVRPFKYMLEEGRSVDFWHVPEYAQMLAVQQEAWNGYAAGTVSSAADALEYTAAKQQEILFNSGRSEEPPPEGTASLTLQ